MAVRGRWLKWQADLIDLRKLMLQNDGVKYILTIIDVFSKYAICVPLKNKKALSIADQFFEIFSVMAPRILQTDNGKEFLGKPYSPLSYIERFNQTIKKKIFTWLANQAAQGRRNSGRYIDVLQDLVYNYNHTVHSSLRETPQTVQFCSANDKSCHQVQNQMVTS